MSRGEIQGLKSFLNASSSRLTLRCQCVPIRVRPSELLPARLHCAVRRHFGTSRPNEMVLRRDYGIERARGQGLQRRLFRSQFDEISPSHPFAYVGFWNRRTYVRHELGDDFDRSQTLENP